MKWYEKFVLFLSTIVFLLLPILQPLNSYASETNTSSGSETSWTMPAETFLQLTFDGFAKQISAPYVVYNTFSDFGYDGFRLWCENGDHWSVIEDGEVVGHGGGGYSRPSDKIDNADNIEVPTDIKNLVLNYVQYNITQNPLSYKECYIYSYNFIDTSTFGNIAPYNSLKNFISSQDGYVLVNYGNFKTASSEQGYMIYVIPKSLNMGLYGTVTSGSFNNVQLSINWLSSQFLNQMSNEIKAYYMTQNGTITEGVQSFNAWQVRTIKNNNSLTFNSTNLQFTMFSNLPKNELVYVFSTLNAYKAYNSGSPQPYYLTSTGANTGTWTASGGGVINTGSMSNSGNYYSQVTNGVGSNWTPEQIIQLVDTVVNGSGGSSSGGSSSDNPFGFLGRLGDLIGQLVGGVGDLLTSIVDGIVSIFLGAEDENGVRSGGLFGTIRDLLTQISSIFDANIGQFVSDVFAWLPSEIITLWTAGIFIAILFGILRIIRG